MIKLTSDPTLAFGLQVNDWVMTQRRRDPGQVVKISGPIAYLQFTTNGPKKRYHARWLRKVSSPNGDSP